jgi:hypothetical protein
VVCWPEADKAMVKMKAPTAAQRNNPLLITSPGRPNRHNVLVDCSSDLVIHISEIAGKTRQERSCEEANL